MDSILITIKQSLGIVDECEDFDDELILFTNSVFSTLNQLGVGPEKGFSIQDDTANWSDYLNNDLKLEFVKRVEFAAAPVGTGARGSEIIMAFKERYYERYDTFVIEKSGQQCLVKEIPVRKADDFWEYVVTLLDSDYESILDEEACQKGDRTMFLTNIQPEFHSEGYIKYQSNLEKHRTWIGEHRVDVSMSSRYDALEDQFISISKGEGNYKKEKFFKLNKAEKDLFDNWQTVKNNQLLAGKTTMDANGKCTQFTSDNRPLIMGDGLIPQYERFASKMQYNTLDVSVFNTVMKQMAEKSDNPIGNRWLFSVNRVLWNDVNIVLGDWLKSWGSAPTMLYSKATGQYAEISNPMKVGASFVSYEIGGNTISFVVDNTLSKLYTQKGYGICMDLTPDMSTGNPAVAGFTLQGKEFTTNKYTGVGFQNGEVASPVAGGKLIVSGYSGVAVFAPYKSFIIRQG